MKLTKLCILLLLVHLSCGDSLKDLVGKIDDGVVDTIDKIHKSYHDVKDGVSAIDKELTLAAQLGPEGIYIALIIAGAEFILLVCLICHWCCDQR